MCGSSATEFVSMKFENDHLTPRAYRVPDACKALGIGKSTLYRLARTGRSAS